MLIIMAIIDLVFIITIIMLNRCWIAGFSIFHHMHPYARINSSHSISVQKFYECLFECVKHAIPHTAHVHINISLQKILMPVAKEKKESIYI